MRCDEVARILPEAVDNGAAVELSVQRHIEPACAARPSSPATAGCSAACSCCAPATSSPRPGLLAQTLAALEEAGERQARPVDPHGPAARLRGRDRRCGGRRRHRGHGHDRPPLPPPCRPGHQLNGPVVTPGSPAGARRSPAGGPASTAILAVRPDRARRAVAQLVEHRSPKPAVGGSSPSCPAPNDDLTEHPGRRRRGDEPTDQAHDGEAGHRQAKSRASERRKRARRRCSQAREDRSPGVPRRGPGRAAQGRLAHQEGGRQLHDHRAHRGRS